MIVRNQQKYFHFDVYLQNIVASSNIEKFISAHCQQPHVDYMECLRSAQDFHENIDMAPSPTAIHLLYDGNVLSISSYPCQCVYTYKWVDIVNFDDFLRSNISFFWGWVTKFLWCRLRYFGNHLNESGYGFISLWHLFDALSTKNRSNIINT